MDGTSLKGQTSAADLLSLLEQATAKLLTVRDPRELVRDLFRLTAEELGLDVYFNYALGADGDLHLVSSMGLSDALAQEGAVLQLGSAVCGCVAKDRLARHISEIQDSDDPQVGFIKKAGLQTYACTPLISGDRLLGTLGFGRYQPSPFTPAELQFLRTLTGLVAVAQERLETVTALRESERRLNAVLNNASVAIFVMDERQQCSFMNAAAERLTGYTFAETQGRPLHDVVHHTHPDGTPYPLEDCPIDRAFPENNNEQCEEVFVHKDGHFYSVAFTASPIRDEASKTVGTIIEVTDISERKRSEEARELLMHEVDHRARNALAVAQSIVELTRAPEIQGYKQAVSGRIAALARAQGSLAAQRYEGGSARQVVEHELGTIARPAQYVIEGPDWTLAPEQVQPLGMVIHELATNAAKHGALSVQDGTVRVALAGQDGTAEVIWAEYGGPPPDSTAKPGFGSRLMRQLADQLDGELVRDWTAGGLRARLTLPRRP